MLSRMIAGPDLIIAAAVVFCIAAAVMLLALSVRRQAEGRVAAVRQRLERLEGLADATQASAEAFDSAMLTVEDGKAQLAWGGDAFGLCATSMGLYEAEGAAPPR